MKKTMKKKKKVGAAVEVEKASFLLPVWANSREAEKKGGKGKKKKVHGLVSVSYSWRTSGDCVS